MSRLPGFEQVQRLATEGRRLFPLSTGTKIPIVKGWPERATSDLTAIEAWTNQYPLCNWGMATGSASGVWVLDIDGAAGMTSLKGLIAEHGSSWTATKIVKTPNSGFHLWYRWDATHPVHNSVNLWPGIDVRGEGGYVVIPPSTLLGVGDWIGKGLDQPIADEELILNLVSARQERNQSAPVASDGQGGRIPEGQRNNTLTSMAGTMRNRGFSEEGILSALLIENAARCQPPLPDRDLQRIVRSIASYEPSPTLVMPPPKPTKDAFLTFRQACNKQPDNTEYLIDGLLPAGAKVCLTAKPKTGKTTLVIDMLRALDQGGMWCDLPCRKVRCVYLTEQAEVSFTEQAREAGVDCLDSHCVLYRADTIGVAWSDIAKMAIAKAVEIGARLLVVDTLNAWAGVTEQNSSIAALAWNALEAAQGHGVTVLATAHSRKNDDLEEVADAISGHNAQAGRADAIFWLHRPSGNNGRKSYRVLEYSGRFSNIPAVLSLDYHDQSYAIVGGDEMALATAACRKALRHSLPNDPARAVTMEALLAATKISRTTMRRCLAESWIGKIGSGRKGAPYRYYLPADAGQADDTGQNERMVGQKAGQNVEPASEATSYRKHCIGQNSEEDSGQTKTFYSIPYRDTGGYVPTVPIGHIGTEGIRGLRELVPSEDKNSGSDWPESETSPADHLDGQQANGVIQQKDTFAGSTLGQNVAQPDQPDQPGRLKLVPEFADDDGDPAVVWEVLE